MPASRARTAARPSGTQSRRPPDRTMHRAALRPQKARRLSRPARPHPGSRFRERLPDAGPARPLPSGRRRVRAAAGSRVPLPDRSRVWLYPATDHSARRAARRPDPGSPAVPRRRPSDRRRRRGVLPRVRLERSRDACCERARYVHAGVRLPADPRLAPPGPPFRRASAVGGSRWLGPEGSWRSRRAGCRSRPRCSM